MQISHDSVIFGRDFHMCGAHQTIAHSFLRETRTNVFTEECSYSLKALKYFYVKIVIPLWVSLCPKSVGSEPYFLEILRYFLASSGEYNLFYASKK